MTYCPLLPARPVPPPAPPSCHRAASVAVTMQSPCMHIMMPKLSAESVLVFCHKLVYFYKLVSVTPCVHPAANPPEATWFHGCETIPNARPTWTGMYYDNSTTGTYQACRDRCSRDKTTPCAGYFFITTSGVSKLHAAEETEHASIHCNAGHTSLSHPTHERIPYAITNAWQALGPLRIDN